MQEKQLPMNENDVDTRIDAYLSGNRSSGGDERERSLIHRLHSRYQPLREHDQALRRVQMRLEHVLIEDNRAKPPRDMTLPAPSPQFNPAHVLPHFAKRRKQGRRWALLAVAVLAVLLFSSALLVARQLDLQTARGTNSAQQSTKPVTLPPNLPLQLYAYYANMANGQSHEGVEHVDPTSGLVDWQFSLKGKFAGAFISPLAAHGTLYFLSTDTSGMTVFAVNQQNGALVWKTLLGSSNSNLALAQNLVYAVKIGTQNSQLMALNAQTGQEVWTQKYSTTSKDTLQIVGTSGNALYAIDYRSAQNRSILYALNGQTGAPLWQQEMAYPEHIIQTQIIGQAIYLAGILDSTASSQATTYIYAYDLSTGKQLWATPINGQVANLAADAHQLYATTGGRNQAGPITAGALYVLNLRNGQMLWQNQLDMFIDALLVTNGRIYLSLRSLQGSAFWHLEALNASNGDLDWQQQEELISGADSLVLLGSSLYLCNLFSIQVIASSTGQELRDLQLHTATASAPLPLIIAVA